MAFFSSKTTDVLDKIYNPSSFFTKPVTPNVTGLATGAKEKVGTSRAASFIQTNENQGLANVETMRGPIGNTAGPAAGEKAPTPQTQLDIGPSGLVGPDTSVSKQIGKAAAAGFPGMAQFAAITGFVEMMNDLGLIGVVGPVAPAVGTPAFTATVAAGEKAERQEKEFQAEQQIGSGAPTSGGMPSSGNTGVGSGQQGAPGGTPGGDSSGGTSGGGDVGGDSGDTGTGAGSVGESEER